jgi:hypothetical protein
MIEMFETRDFQKPRVPLSAIARARTVLIVRHIFDYHAADDTSRHLPFFKMNAL